MSLHVFGQIVVIDEILNRVPSVRLGCVKPPRSSSPVRTRHLRRSGPLLRRNRQQFRLARKSIQYVRQPP